jgi:hypothetical protein
MWGEKVSARLSDERCPYTLERAIPHPAALLQKVTRAKGYVPLGTSLSVYCRVDCPYLEERVCSNAGMNNARY